MQLGRMVAASRLLVILLVVGVLAAPARADESFADGAKMFIGNLADEAITQLTAEGIGPEERDRRFRDIMKRYIAFESVARWVLGRRYWKQASEAQQQEYLSLFEDLMVATYAHRFAKYSGEKLEISDTQVVNENQAVVLSKIQRPGATKPLRVDWRVRAKEGKYLIIDILVEGLSMAQAQRAEFASALKNNGGDLDALLAEIRDRLEQARIAEGSPS